jgi:lipopolysaccharide transport system ATP-binding protein
MSDVVIRAENLGKKYRIHHQQERQRYVALRDVFTDKLKSPWRWLSKKNANPQSAIRNPQSIEDFWALKEVSFEIREGEVVGIIGRNGAGKSTLLKILSRITEPTQGRVRLRGRVASLLEVGTGFHPELTGRENIYLNGAILGMGREEIRRKFDEIVDFAEIEKFLDTPVKRYSSGMYVRLAFAVAAHLDSEILVIDEVLAVGDANFQRKCLGKMKDVSVSGRTVLFVSHNMTVVNSLCDRAILLSKGSISLDDRAAEVVTQYFNDNSSGEGEYVWEDIKRAPGNDRIRLKSVRIIVDEEITSEVPIDKDFSVEVEFYNLKQDTKNLCANIYLLDSLGNTIISTGNTPSASTLPNTWFYEPHPTGTFRARCTFPGNFLNEGLFHINVYLVTLGPICIEAQAEQAISFSVYDTGSMREPGGGNRWDGVIRMRFPWRTEFIAPDVAQTFSSAIAE